MTKTQKSKRTPTKPKSKPKSKKTGIDFVSHKGDYRPLRHLRKSLFRQNKRDTLSIM